MEIDPLFFIRQQVEICEMEMFQLGYRIFSLAQWLLTLGSPNRAQFRSPICTEKCAALFLPFHNRETYGPTNVADLRADII